MELALFDLDHTLIPFDSGALFTRHLAAMGALPPAFEAQYLEYCRLYAQGRVDMREMHRFTVGALSVHSPAQLEQWLHEFRAAIARRVPAASLALVRDHEAAGHACVLVTATTRFVAQAFGDALGLSEVLATEPEVDARGRYTGEVVGEPCFREHKIAHVTAWLARRGAGWADVTRSWFYSDSINDLPLLEHVTDPVATNPDPTLLALALAQARAWPVRYIGADD